MDFVGRAAELRLLGKRLDRVENSGVGVAVAIRGRRQVGKSRLVQEFCDTAAVPYMYYTATKGMSQVEAVSAFLAELRDSSLPADPEAVPEGAPGGWPDAFRALAGALPDAPSIVVMDELPWVAEQDETFDGALQLAWDRLLSRRPVLLIILGSDIHIMERLTAYDRPFYGRADNLALGPLNPAETGLATGLDGAGDVLDAHLISGGLPGILRSWPNGMPPMHFVEQECADPAAPLFGVPESSLLVEFPLPDQAKRVLEAVGSGDRTFARIAAAAGGRKGPLASGSLSPLLGQLTDDKRVLAVDRPLSTKPGKPALYRVADSNLRLYLAALRSAQELSRRGRPQAAYDMFTRRWTSWRGRAIEPLIREALELAAISGAFRWSGIGAVGGWWNRQFDPEIDLVGADRSPVAERLHFAGSIKWLASPFNRHDLADLARTVVHIPGYNRDSGGLVVVSLGGLAGDVSADAVDYVWSVDDVLSAWSSS
jgi:uncharacterized protein